MAEIVLHAGREQEARRARPALGRIGRGIEALPAQAQQEELLQEFPRLLLNGVGTAAAGVGEDLGRTPGAVLDARRDRVLAKGVERRDRDAQFGVDRGRFGQEQRLAGAEEPALAFHVDRSGAEGRHGRGVGLGRIDEQSRAQSGARARPIQDDLRRGREDGAAQEREAVLRGLRAYELEQGPAFAGEGAFGDELVVLLGRDDRLRGLRRRRRRGRGFDRRARHGHDRGRGALRRGLRGGGHGRGRPGL